MPPAIGRTAGYEGLKRPRSGGREGHGARREPHSRALVARSTRPTFVLTLVLLFSLVVRNSSAFDPYVNQCPLGPAIGCAMHDLAFELATTRLGRLLPPGSRRRRQVWDSLYTGDMEEGTLAAAWGVQRTAPAGAAVLCHRHPHRCQARTFVDASGL